MNYDDCKSRSPEDQSIFDEMERIRDSILDSLTPMEKAALFQDYDEFRHKYIDYMARDLYE